MTGDFGDLRHEALLEYIRDLPIGVYRSTVEGRLLIANQALADILGHDSVDEIMETDTRDTYVDPSVRNRVFEAAYSAGARSVTETQLRRKDGSIIWVRMTARPIPIETFETRVLDGVLEDVSEAYTMKAALELSEERFRAAFERSLVPMVMRRPVGDPLAMNPAAEQLLQATVGDLAGGDFASYLDPEDLEDSGRRMKELARTKGDGYEVVRHLRLPDGSRRWARVGVNAVWEDDQMESIVIQIVDIDDLMRAQQRLEELVISKDDLVRSVSHELRTPLTSILGLASELESRWNEFSEDERVDHLAVITQQGLEMADLIDDLLTAARGATASISINPSVVQLDDVVRSMGGLWSSSGDIEFLIEPDVKAYADPARVRQILRNLISNALRHGEEPVAVRVGAQDSSVTVEVEDNGPELPEELHERIFEPYFQVAKPEDTRGSVGLGLSVSRNLARLMEGDLVYLTNSGKSCFRLSLPGDPQ